MQQLLDYVNRSHINAMQCIGMNSKKKSMMRAPAPKAWVGPTADASNTWRSVTSWSWVPHTGSSSVTLSPESEPESGGNESLSSTSDAVIYFRRIDVWLGNFGQNAGSRRGVTDTNVNETVEIILGIGVTLWPKAPALLAIAVNSRWNRRWRNCKLGRWEIGCHRSTVTGKASSILRSIKHCLTDSK